MRPTARRPLDHAGFTLVETLASLLIFTLVTLGLVPLVLSSIRGTNLSRSATIGRNVASEAMERLRGLPFYVANSTQNQRVDALDFYFPQASGSGFDATTNTYTVSCTGSGTGACPTSLPANYTLEFRSAFVTRSGSPEVYTPVAPAASYAWNSSGNDGPQSELLLVEITARWSLQGRNRAVTLTTLLGDRAFGGLQARSSAVSAYVVQVLTGFAQGSDEEDVIASAGIAEANATARRLSDASQTIRAGSLRLVDARTVQPDLLVEGAIADVAAPPQVTSTSSSGISGTLTSPAVGWGNFGDVAGIRPTNTSGVQASVGTATPAASGAWSFLPGTGTELDFWVDNPGADRINPSLFRFSSERLLTVRTKGSDTLEGATAAQVNALGSGVTSSTTGSFNDLRLMPTNFIPGAPCVSQSPCLNSSFGGAVVAIDGFTATTSCQADTSTSTASATAEYSATVYYWVDPAEDNINQGQYVAVPLSVSSATPVSDALADLKAQWDANPALIPLVYDDSDDEDDVYLFPVNHDHPSPTQDHEHEGYLADWSSDGELETNILQNGRLVSADIDNAITLLTRPTAAGEPESSFTVSVGNFSCTAEERR